MRRTDGIRGLRGALALLTCAAALAGCGGSSRGPDSDRADAATTAASADAVEFARSTATRRYVATSGRDAGPGTASQPWRTVQHGLDAIRPGEILVIRGGAYRESLVASRAGTPSQRVTIRNYPGERPVIRGDGGITLEVGDGAAYLTFRGLVLEGATGDSTTNIYLSGNAHHIDLASCEVRGSERQGLFSEASTNSVRVLGCNFHDNGGSGPDNQDHNIYMEGTGHTIANSIIVGARNGYGIQVYPSSRSILVTNNTVVGNRSGIILGSEEGGRTSGITIVNNIIAFNDRIGISTYWGEGPPGARNVAEANLLYRNQGGSIDRSEGGLAVSRNTPGNPRFVNRAGRDFRLSAGSPALGRAIGSFAPAADFRGRSRKASGRPDLGALER